MRKLNVTYALILGLGLSASAFASTSASTTAGSAFANPANLQIDLTGGWFRGMVQNEIYGVNAATGSVATPPTGTGLRNDPDSNFGGALAVAYRFAASPYSLSASWWRAHGDNSETATGNIGVTRLPANGGVDYADTATSKLDHENDIVNVAIGAVFNPTPNIMVTPKIGVTYLHAKNDETLTYSGGSFIADGQTITSISDSKFTGVGPSIGVDLNYELGRNFAIFGNFAYSAVVGDIDASLNSYQTPTVSTSITTNVSLDKNYAIVGLFQSEAGLAYTFLPCWNYWGKIMVGYTVNKATGTTINNAMFVDDVGDSNFRSQNTDTGFQGPFARLSFAFNV